MTTFTTPHGVEVTVSGRKVTAEDGPESGPLALVSALALRLTLGGITYTLEATRRVDGTEEASLEINRKTPLSPALLEAAVRELATARVTPLGR